MARKRGRALGALFGILLVALALRLALLPRLAHHTDEYRSLYRALRIFGGDVFLRGDPSQKPPLFYLLLAGLFEIGGPSDRLALAPNLIASLAGVLLLYAVARRLYGDAVIALAAAWFLATARFDVLFAPTIFLDPFMIGLVLGAWLLALQNRPVAAGLVFGLAVATKQQAALFLPLLLGSAVVLADAGPIASPIERGRRLVRFVAGALPVGAFLLWWGSSAERAPLHFIFGQIENERRAIGDSLFVLPWRDGLGDLGARAVGWWGIARATLGPPWLTALAVLALVVAIASDRSRSGAGDPRADPKARRDRRADVLLAAQILVFVGTYALIRFRFVDRYALALVPLLCLALARGMGIVVFATVGWSNGPRRAVLAATFALAVVPLVGTLRTVERTLREGNTGFGAQYAGRPTLRPFLLRLAAVLRPDDEIYCDLFTHPAATFYLRPRFTAELTEEHLVALERSGGESRSSGRFLLWSGELPIAPIRNRLARRFELVPVEDGGGGIRLYRIDPIGRTDAADGTSQSPSRDDRTPAS